ncbi:pyroglutamyl-peptidase [Curtobacterium sp. PhB115]|nr:pyroglutamyl-peptidase [Curtobacterium sp. PhB115]
MSFTSASYDQGVTDPSGRTVLLTAFEPFGGAERNPSWDAVQRVAETWDGPATVVVEQLPVAFAEVRPALAAAIQRHRPEIVIATGVAEGRAAVTPERVAINVDDARIPDNVGAQPIDEPIDPHGPTAYLTGLPVKRIVRDIRAAGGVAAVSNTAGTFTCNHVFYDLMSIAGREGIRAGFVHVPATPESATGDVPTLELAAIADALTIAVLATLDPAPDAVAVGGAEH